MKVFFVYHTVNSYSNNLDKRTYSIFRLLSLVQVDVEVFGRMEYVGYIGRFEEILVNQRYGMRLVQSQWDLSEYRLCYFSQLVVASARHFTFPLHTPQQLYLVSDTWYKCCVKFIT